MEGRWPQSTVHGATKQIASTANAGSETIDSEILAVRLTPRAPQSASYRHIGRAGHQPVGRSHHVIQNRSGRTPPHHLRRRDQPFLTPFLVRVSPRLADAIRKRVVRTYWSPCSICSNGSQALRREFAVDRTKSAANSRLAVRWFRKFNRVAGTEIFHPYSQV